MRRGNKLLTPVLAALGMGLLILDARTALEGAREGIALCLKTVVPSLFPFFVVSILLTGTLAGKKLPGFSVLGRLCGIPAGAESLLLVGFLGGYPVGAQSISQACQAGQLRVRDGKRMLGFCNNAGPAFLFGMAGALFRSPVVPWVLWAIHIVSALLTAMLLPGKSSASASIRPGPGISLPEAMTGAIRAMAGVCGWVILFRVLIAILQRWCLWLLPQTGQVLLTGFLELSNGCCDLSKLPGQGLRFILCACFLGFGGLCVAMQTVSVTRSLGTGAYFPGKGLQCLFSFLLASITQYLLFPAEERAGIPLPLLVVTLFICCLFPFLLKNNSRNPAAAGV